jgi:uncharacterized protein (DUF2252 family)
MLEQMIEGYVGALVHSGKTNVSAPKPVQRILRKALRRRWHHLAEERIEDARPEIPLGKRFWPLSAGEKKEIRQIFEAAEVRRLVTCLKDRYEHDDIEVLDSAYWIKGCSSLGRLRFAVLLGVGKNAKKDSEFCIIDIKEAVEPVAPHSPNVHMPRDNAERVVEGARKLSPFLGKRMLPWRIQGKSAVIRELLPQDLKLEMDQLTRDEAISSARFLASVVGRAHSSQLDQQTRKDWLNDLRKGRSRKLDAPSWLWNSVVELVASHESAYLEHCRAYALDTN